MVEIEIGFVAFAERDRLPLHAFEKLLVAVDLLLQLLPFRGLPSGVVVDVEAAVLGVIRVQPLPDGGPVDPVGPDGAGPRGLE